jgi:hypothetical protein
MQQGATIYGVPCASDMSYCRLMRFNCSFAISAEQVQGHVHKLGALCYFLPPPPTQHDTEIIHLSTKRMRKS